MTPTPSPGSGPLSIALRFALLVAFVLAATWASHLIRDALDLQVKPENEQQVHMAIMAGSVAYVGLLALPFVPGAEIGIALLTAFGAAIAPLVYGATILAMMLAFTVGRFLPPTALARMLDILRMKRGADLIRRAAGLPRQDRLALLLDGQPPRLVALALRHRYVALGLAVNVPGNALIGGGGGIMMMAGMSGLFSPLQTLIAVALAVSPVPLAVILIGA